MMGPSNFAVSFSGYGIYSRRLAAQEQLLRTEPTDHGTRARLHATLTAACLFSDEESASLHAEKSRHAAALAGSEEARAWSLIARSLIAIAPGKAAERAAWAKEALDIAMQIGETEYVSTAYFLYLGALAEAGDLSEVDRALSENGNILPHFPWLDNQRHALWFKCLRATMDGQLSLAEELSTRAFDVAQLAGDPDAQSVMLGQLAVIRWMQGRIEEMEPPLLQARQKSPHEPIWAASLAWVWLSQGRRGAVQGLIESLPPFHDLPIDRNWLATACILGSAAAELGLAGRCRAIRDAILPHEGSLVTIGLGITCWGTVSRCLALIERSLGNIDASVQHYEKAIASSAQWGAQPWLAEAQAELADLLIQEYGSTRREEAAALKAEALATARALQLPWIEAQALKVGAVEELRGDAETVTAADARASEAAAPVVRIEAFGRFIVYDTQGQAAIWKSRKARSLLQILVARRGASISRETLMHLLWPDIDPRILANRFSVALSTARRTLDPASTLERDALIETSGSSIRLRAENVQVDVEEALKTARDALALSAEDPVRHQMLEQAAALTKGHVFDEEAEEPWLEDFQTVVRTTFYEVLHALAQSSTVKGDHLTALNAYERLLSSDRYDERAHLGVINSLRQLGAPARAAEAENLYRERMDEISID